MAIVGYDNIRMAELFNPSITTIAQPHYEMGEAAMGAVLARIGHREPGGVK